jgi:hypothetical protein
MPARYLRYLFSVVVVGVFAFGASEAFAARGEIIKRECGAWNWCAPSEGGQENCNDCCFPDDGLCISFQETENQGCVCISG